MEKNKTQNKVLVCELGGKEDVRWLFGGVTFFLERCGFSSALLQRGLSTGHTVNCTLWGSGMSSGLQLCSSALALQLCLVTLKRDRILLGQASTMFMAVLALQSPKYLDSLWAGGIG